MTNFFKTPQAKELFLAAFEYSQLESDEHRVMERVRSAFWAGAEWQRNNSTSNITAVDMEK